MIRLNFQNGDETRNDDDVFTLRIIKDDDTGRDDVWHECGWDLSRRCTIFRAWNEPEKLTPWGADD